MFYLCRYVATAPSQVPTLVAAPAVAAVLFTLIVAYKTVPRISMLAHSNPFAKNTSRLTSRVPLTMRSAQYVLIDWYPGTNPLATLNICMGNAAATAGTIKTACRTMQTLRVTSSSVHYAMIPLNFLRSKIGESLCQIGRFINSCFTHIYIYILIIITCIYCI